jgi:hypothetical protein
VRKTAWIDGKTRWIGARMFVIILQARWAVPGEAIRPDLWEDLVAVNGLKAEIPRGRWVGPAEG